MEQISFQVVEKFKLTPKMCNEDKLIKGLKGEKMKTLVEPIRKLLAEGEMEKADSLKKALPAILVSGIFRGGRTADKLAVYSHVICLDLDNIDTDKVHAFTEEICKCEYTFIAFISPSGQGVKILVKVDSGSNYHRDAYKQVVRFYSDLLKVEFDEKTCDICRLTFMSYDPDPYYYPDSKIFEVKTPIGCVNHVSSQHQVIDASSDKYKGLYDQAYSFTLNRQKNEHGNRNNFMFLLASNSNRYGIPKEILLTLTEWSDLPYNEREAILNSAYKKVELFNTWQMKQSSQTLAREQDSKLTYEEATASTPVISNDIKKRLPDLLQGLVANYSDRQSDMALTALLSLFSGMMSTTRGIYQHSVIYPALSSVITAPSGSGKSVTGVMQRLFLPLHFQIKRSGELSSGLFLPDNTSTTALVKHLANNEGIGILFSTDLGFLGHALKRDTAGLQAILRAAHSGEIFNNGRSLKKEAIMVETPRLAACLSATPPEFQHLFTSTEDGLISRFIHYCFVPDREWQEIQSNDIVSHIEVQQQFSDQILDMYRYINDRSFTFNLRDEQLLALNEWLFEQTEMAKNKDSWVAINPIIKRMGQTAFKLSMIFTTIRAWETNSQTVELKVNADDFDTVMELLKVYFHHAACIVKYAIQNEVVKGVDIQLERFFNSLPNASFKRKEALDAAKDAGLSVSFRTVDNWLKKLTELDRISSSYNSYCKLEKEGKRLLSAA